MTILRILIKSKTIQFCAIAASLAGLLIAKGIEYNLSKSDWSSWVQAFGSIGAIVGAFLVAERQFVKSREIDIERVAEEKIRKAHILNAILFNICGTCGDLQRANDSDEYHFLQSFDLSILTHQADLLRSIPPLDFPAAQIVYAVIGLPQKIIALESCMRRGQVDAPNPERCVPFMRSYRLKENILEVLRVAHSGMVECRKVLPGLH